MGFILIIGKDNPSFSFYWKKNNFQYICLGIQNRKKLEHQKFILSFLKYNKSVVLPDIGAFILKEKSAAFNKTKGVFEPPGKEISFDASIKFVDPKFLEYISSKFDIPADELKKDFLEYCNNILQELNKGNFIEIAGIGKLTKTDERIHLSPYPDETIQEETYGLLELEAKEIKTDEAIHQTLKEPKKKKRAKRSNKKVILWSGLMSFFALMIVFAVLVFFTDIINFQKNLFIHTNNQTAVQPDTASVQIKTDTAESYNNLKDSLARLLEQKKSKREALYYEEPQEQDDSKYIIIAGSFKKLENAKIFSYKFEKLGYSPTILKQEGNFYRIAIYSFDNQKEALDSLYKVRKRQEMKTAWLLKSF